MVSFRFMLTISWSKIIIIAIFSISRSPKKGFVILIVRPTLLEGQFVFFKLGIFSRDKLFVKFLHMVCECFIPSFTQGILCKHIAFFPQICQLLIEVGQLCGIIVPKKYHHIFSLQIFFPAFFKSDVWFSYVREYLYAKAPGIYFILLIPFEEFIVAKQL